VSALLDFYGKVKRNSALKADIDAARKGLGPHPSREAAAGAVIQVAQKHGIYLTKADFELKPGTVDDEELKAVAGGCSPCPHTEITVIW